MKTNMSATQILRDDHKSLRGLFRQLEAVDKRAASMTDGVVREVLSKLQIHSRMEEEIFYPALLDSLDADNRSLVQECLQDHVEVDRLVGEIRRIGTGELNHVPPQIEDLIESVELHLRKEEDDLFFLVERELAAERLFEIGARLKALQEQLVQRPEFRDAHQAAQNPNGGEQMRVVQ